MAKWPINPDWISPTIINNGNEVSSADGFLASDQNKIVSNIIFLYNHLTDQHVYVGNVTTITLPEGEDANVSITPRYEQPSGEDPQLYLDFVFEIPEGVSAKFDTPTASATRLNYNQQPTAKVTATGPDTNKKFNFVFGIPEGAPANITGVDGSIEMLPEGSTPEFSATVDTAPGVNNVHFQFKLPEGKQGPPGPSSSNKYAASIVTFPKEQLYCNNIDDPNYPNYEQGKYTTNLNLAAPLGTRGCIVQVWIRKKDTAQLNPGSYANELINTFVVIDYNDFEGIPGDEFTKSKTDINIKIHSNIPFNEFPIGTVLYDLSATVMFQGEFVEPPWWDNK